MIAYSNAVDDWLLSCQRLGDGRERDGNMGGGGETKTGEEDRWIIEIGFIYIGTLTVRVTLHLWVVRRHHL